MATPFYPHGGAHQGDTPGDISSDLEAGRRSDDVVAEDEGDGDVVLGGLGGASKLGDASLMHGKRWLGGLEANGSSRLAMLISGKLELIGMAPVALARAMGVGAHGAGDDVGGSLRSNLDKGKMTTGSTSCTLIEPDDMSGARAGRPGFGTEAASTRVVGNAANGPNYGGKQGTVF
ncbi:unnamed protein product [Ilex paraguariensis]|uniref:Uncharacterized protein n=1 Tax=Ilex paraguariensis TaxID=185542 RepID=A0ABC8TN84_9AQUA